MSPVFGLTFYHLRVCTGNGAAYDCVKVFEGITKDMIVLNSGGTTIEFVPVLL